MTRIFGFGTAAVDFRISVADFGPNYKAKLLAQNSRLYGGGAVANSLCQAALLGAETQWLGKLGDDPIGRMIMTDLKQRGVGTDFVVIDRAAISPFNLAVYAGESRRRIGGFLLPNCMADIDDGDIDAFCAAIRPGDWCLVELGELPISDVLAYCRKAKERKSSIMIDIDLDPIAQCECDPVHITDLFSTVDILMPNYEAMQTIYSGLSPKELAARLLQDYGKLVVVTAGADGCYYSDGGEVIREKPLKVEVADTVGAGDAFHGGFLWALSNGRELGEAARVGNACGAANCRAFGAREGMLDAVSLDRFMVREE